MRFPALNLSITPRCYPPEITKSMERWKQAVAENRPACPQDQATVFGFLQGEHQRLVANHLLSQLDPLIG